MKAKPAKKSVAQRLIDSMEEGLEALRADKELSGTFVALPPDPPQFDRTHLQTLRRRSKMSQPGFAIVLNVSVKALESWEQGVRQPNGAALRLLQFLENPSLLLSMVKGAGSSRKTQNEEPASELLKRISAEREERARLQAAPRKTVVPAKRGRRTTS